MAYSQFKYAADFTFALFLCVASLPICLIVALIIKLEDPSDSVIFKQVRIGQHNQSFTLYKFRSMRSDKETNGTVLSDGDRLLRTGKVIRKMSVDELPQLINILKGDMSFIGPRPLLEEYLPYYSKDEKRRHEVKPGISGWAQVNGRNRVSWEEKFAYDVYYVNHQSLALDLKILFLTIQKVFTGSDVSEAGPETERTLVQDRFHQNKNRGRRHV